MAVYLLHIDPPLRHSRHYIGYARRDQLEERIKRHCAGTGGVLPREAVKRGSTITVARVWLNAPQAFERYVKKHGGASRWCPLCGLKNRKRPSLAGWRRSLECAETSAPAIR